MKNSRLLLKNYSVVYFWIFLAGLGPERPLLAGVLSDTFTATFIALHCSTPTLYCRIQCIFLLFFDKIDKNCKKSNLKCSTTTSLFKNALNGIVASQERGGRLYQKSIGHMKVKAMGTFWVKTIQQYWRIWMQVTENCTLISMYFSFLLK